MEVVDQSDVGNLDQDASVKSENEEKVDALGVKGGTIRKPLPKATIRRRNNARIKKMVAPKAPVQVLNELVGPGNVKYTVLSPNPGMMAMHGPKLVTAEVLVDGQTFSGSGPNKTIAKNIAAEAAIHFVVMQKNKELPPEDGGRFQDSTPWGALASLALFKLFNDWQSSGYSLPGELCSKELDMKAGVKVGMGMMCGQMQGNMGEGERMLSGLGLRPGLGQGFDFTDEAGTFHAFSSQSDVFSHCKQAMGMGPMLGMGGGGTMPQMGGGPGHNMGQMGAQKHPVSLLNEKRGRENPVSYECEEAGELPAKVFSMTCKVDGQTFTGEGKSKKEAKKFAAVKALSELYGIQY